MDRTAIIEQVLERAATYPAEHAWDWLMCQQADYPLMNDVPPAVARKFG